MTSDLRTASQISTDMLNRQATVTIGNVTGQLAAILPVADRVWLVLIVGGARASFQLDADTPVEVHRQQQGAT